MLTFNSAPDHETKSSYAITVTASDGTNTTNQAVTVNVTDLNDSGPVFTSSNAQDIDEREQTETGKTWADYSVTTIGVTDDIGDEDSNITLEMNAGGDGRYFQLTGRNLHYHAGRGGRDYERPADLNSDNIYELEITATNDLGSSIINMSVTINNVNDEVPVCSIDTKNVSVDEETSGYVIDVSQQMDSCSDADGNAFSFALDNYTSVDDVGTLGAIFDEVAKTITITTPDRDDGGYTSGNLSIRVDDPLIGVSWDESIRLQISNRDVNDNAPYIRNDGQGMIININEMNGPKPSDWVLSDTDWVVGFSIRDHDLLHDYTDLSLSLSGTDANAFQIMTSLPSNITETSFDCSNSTRKCHLFYLQLKDYRDYETLPKTTYNLVLNATDGERSSQTNLTVNILDTVGTNDSTTDFKKQIDFRQYYADNENSKTFNKIYQLDQKQPWGIGIIFTPSSDQANRLLQISPLRGQQNVSSAYGLALEDAAYIEYGADSGGQFIEIKYHQFVSSSPVSSYGFKLKHYFSEASNKNYESWGIYFDFDGTSNTPYDETAFRAYMVELGGHNYSQEPNRSGTKVIDLMTHPNSTVSFDYNGNIWTTGAPNRTGYLVDYNESITGRNPNTDVYFDTLVATTFLPDDLPDNDEIRMIITDPMKWLENYKIGQSFRRYSGTDLTEAEHLKSNFQLGDSDSASSTQIYIFCEGDYEDLSNSNIPNIVWSTNWNTDNGNNGGLKVVNDSERCRSLGAYNIGSDYFD